MLKTKLIILTSIALCACDDPKEPSASPELDCRQMSQTCAEGLSCEADANGVYSCVEQGPAAGEPSAGVEPQGGEALAGAQAGEVPVGGDEPPVGGDEPPVGGDEPPGGGDEPPGGGDEPPVGGDEPPVGGDEPPAGGDVPPPVDPNAPCSASPAGCPSLGWVMIEGGSFTMGSDSGQVDESPAHEVSVESFQMMRSEVTVSMYRACVDAFACTPLSTFSAACTWTDVPETKEDYPANCMTWFQLKDFADWVGARLPTEAEWEFAARGRGRDVTYPWGDDEPNCGRANFLGCAEGTSVVCSLPAGNTPEGLCDMAGNVWEWVQDEYHNSYQGAPVDGSGWCATPNCEAEPGMSAPFRVLRGGYWSGEADVLRATYRNSASPIVEFGFRGGRLAY